MTPRHGVLRVVTAGALSTIQDCGRRDVARYGVSPSGAADWFSARAANLLVGNEPCAPLLETTLNGAAFEMARAAHVAVTGAAAALEIAGTPARLWRAHAVSSGARVKVGSPQRGIRSYIALAGGFDVPLVLGGASTDVASGFGGFEGRALRTGDVLSGHHVAPHPPDVSRGEHLLSYRGPIPSWDSPLTLRIVPGPHRRVLSESAWAQLLSREWSVASRSTRQGVAFEGEALGSGPTDVASAGACAGCVQVTSAGLPVVLLAEHQTTAGYALVGCVISADLPRAAQARPGDVVRFMQVTQAQAASLRDLLERTLTAAMTPGLSRELATGFFEGW